MTSHARIRHDVTRARSTRGAPITRINADNMTSEVMSGEYAPAGPPRAHARVPIFLPLYPQALYPEIFFLNSKYSLLLNMYISVLCYIFNQIEHGSQSENTFI